MVEALRWRVVTGQGRKVGGLGDGGSHHDLNSDEGLTGESGGRDAAMKRGVVVRIYERVASATQ